MRLPWAPTSTPQPYLLTYLLTYYGSTHYRCASFGICLNTTTYPLCLSVWRGEVFDGAPVVWSRCRTDVKRHQQWALPATEVHDGSFRVQLRGSDATHGEALCVAAPSAAALAPARSGA